MIGYLFTALVCLYIGFYFMQINLHSGYPYFSYVIVNSMIIFIFTIPLLTMRSMAEERKQKTDQMLLTYPISVTKIVMGKYFAMITVLAIPMLICCMCPIIIMMNGNSFLLVDYASIFALYCLGCMFVSIGMFISSMTENQIIAAVATLAVLLVFYLWSSIVSAIPQTAIASLIGLIVIFLIALVFLYLISRNKFATLIVGIIGIGTMIGLHLFNDKLFAGLLPKALNAFACDKILSNFTTDHVFDVGGLLSFASISALFIFLTVQSIQKRRWS